jgi:hypothetical protein
VKNKLLDLSNPLKFQKPIEIGSLNSALLKKMLKSMILIRKTEQQLALGRKNNLIGVLFSQANETRDKEGLANRMEQDFKKELYRQLGK